jgi:hypothetical protein
MVRQISRVSCTQVALRRGVTTHLPTVRLGLQSARLQFNQRSYRHVVEIIRGVKACARGVPYPHASEWVSWSVAQAERVGRPDHCASAGAQGRQLKTFPRGSNELNFGYHVSVCHSLDHEADSRRKPFQRCMYQEYRTSHGHMHALVSPLYYTTHHSCTLLDTSSTHNTLLTWPSPLEPRVSPKYQPLKFPSGRSREPHETQPFQFLTTRKGRPSPLKGMECTP